MKTKKRKYLIILCVLALAALLLSGCTQETASLDYIGAENASSLALESVGLTEGQVERISASLSTKNGVDYYEVELTVDGVQYEIDVDALTGVIIDGEAPASAAEQAAQVAAQVAATLETTETETAAVTEETAASAAESTANSTGTDTANSTDAAANTSTASTAAASSTSSTSSTSTVANVAAITEDEAKSIALADAGLTEAEVTITKLKLDYDNGQQVYDIEFYTANYDEYDYEISVSTGAIVERDYDPAKTTSSASTSTGTTSTSGTSSTSGSTGSSSTTSTLITESEARSIALASAGLSESSVTFTKTKLDTDDGQKVYDVEFYTTDAEYEYEINASTGAILDSSYEVRSTASTSTSTSTTITADEAKAIALAQVPGASASNIREFETDYDDGRLQYEGKIIYDGMEYEFEIDGYSGAIRSWEAERAD
ncbi:MAG: PepSY domain-containing protein [Oscillospiraceae bacterium]|nr:PepSY domain-containing protein [Oscillospiraceae bacterium]